MEDNFNFSDLHFISPSNSYVHFASTVINDPHHGSSSVLELICHLVYMQVRMAVMAGFLPPSQNIIQLMPSPTSSLEKTFCKHRAKYLFKLQSTQTGDNYIYKQIKYFIWSIIIVCFSPLHFRVQQQSVNILLSVAKCLRNIFGTNYRNY